jgi:hypothetical protein
MLFACFLPANQSARLGSVSLSARLPAAGLYTHGQPDFGHGTTTGGWQSYHILPVDLTLRSVIENGVQDFKRRAHASRSSSSTRGCINTKTFDPPDLDKRASTPASLTFLVYR